MVNRPDPTATGVDGLIPNQAASESGDPAFNGIGWTRPSSVSAKDWGPNIATLVDTLKLPANLFRKYKLVMRAFVAAVITDAIKKTHVRNCGCKEVTVRFHSLNQKIITRDKFVSDIFDNPDVVMDQFSGKSQTVPPQTHWFGVKDSNVAWTAPDADTLQAVITNTTNQPDAKSGLTAYPGRLHLKLGSEQEFQ